MRVLLDECVPRQFRRALTGFDVKTVSEMGWSGKRNSALIKMMVEHRFDALLTVDRNLEYQQNIQAAGIGIVVLVVPSNRPEDVLPFAPHASSALADLKPGQVVRIDA